jgi:DnaT DNA-binding domain
MRYPTNLRRDTGTTMSDFSLLPERQLLFSPLLAATIGLEEAILLQHLQGVLEQRSSEVQGGYAWFTVERALLLRSLPFWTLEDLHRISRNLVDKGVLLIATPPLLTAAQLTFAINEPVSQARTAQPVAPSVTPMIAPTVTSLAAQNTDNSTGNSADHSATQSRTDATNRVKMPLVIPTKRGAGLLPAHWQPSEDLLQWFTLHHNIPRQFALGQLEDFIFYWRERGETSHAWENKFRQHVISVWRREQQDKAEAFQVPQSTTLDNTWRPSADAMDIMLRADIAPDFIEESLPEFILYWRERGANPKELNSKFIQHIRIQWAKFTSSLTHSTEPKRITEQWQPAEDVYDILRLSHIDTEFARSLLPEFIVYWRDSNQALSSWNSKFLQHAKYHWAKRHQIEHAGHSHAGQSGTSKTGRTRDRSLQQDLTDTSWAD